MPWTGLTAPSMALKTSTTALSLRMFFWSIVRKFWWEKQVAKGANIFRCVNYVHWRHYKSLYRPGSNLSPLCISIRAWWTFFVCYLPEAPWQSWSRAVGLVRSGQMYPGCSGSQRTACCWWPPGGSSGRTRCSSGRSSKLPCRNDQVVQRGKHKDFNNFNFIFTVIYEETYFGSVIRRISLQRRPMKVADSSTEGNFGMGMWVDWCTLCQSWIWLEARKEAINHLPSLTHRQTTRAFLIDYRGTNWCQCTI